MNLDFGKLGNFFFMILSIVSIFHGDYAEAQAWALLSIALTIDNKD